jgi:hypothetical protein
MEKVMAESDGGSNTRVLFANGAFRVRDPEMEGRYCGGGRKKKEEV